MDNVVVNDSLCALTEREMEGIMEEALAEKQFLAYYQPQYNHTTGLLVGAEALVRWNLDSRKRDEDTTSRIAANP